MRLLLIASMALLACGGATAGSGACVEDVVGRSFELCLNFHDTATQTGKDLCTAQAGVWTPGTTCEALGFTKECSANAWVKPASPCQ